MRFLVGNIFVHLSIVLIGIVSCLVGSSSADVGSLYGGLRGFMSELGSVMKEVVNGIQKLSNGIKEVEEFLDATVDEDCVFECPIDHVAKPRMHHKPISNGCGSYGLEDYITENMLPMTEFRDCCDAHDICYETCGADKDECDLKLKKCLYRRCNENKYSVSKLKHKGCQAGAKVLYMGTTALGCKPYMNAQQSACDCIPVHNEF